MFKKNMAEIVKIKKDGVIQYPITKPECVIDENGKNVLQLIKENGGGGSSATPDWSATEGKEGHILNRTHYKDVEIYDSTFKYNEDGDALTPKYARLRDDYGNLSDLLPVSDDFEEFLDGFPLYDEYGDTTGYASGTLIVQPYNHTIRFDSDYEDEHYYVESVYESLKQLDEEFIPDTIARKSEITELREAIEDLDTRVAAHSEDIVNLQENKADKSELTELSAEVSGLSERIENLPTAESSVFEAVYRETTFAEIVEAYNAGKSVTCRYGATIAQLIFITDSAIYFTSINIKKETRYICYSSNSWTYNEHDTGHELKTLDNGNVQVTIAGKTAEVATPQYVQSLIVSTLNTEV